MEVENKAMSDRQWSEFIFKMILNGQEGSGLNIEEEAEKISKIKFTDDKGYKFIIKSSIFDETS
jgi:hypothetical protein